jgi:uncharacterized protein
MALIATGASDHLSEGNPMPIIDLPSDAPQTGSPRRPQAARVVIGPTRARSLRAWTARRPITAFLVMVFALAYPVMSLPVLADHGVIPDGWMPQAPGLDTGRIAAVLLVFAALLPSVLWVTWALEGRAGLRTLSARMFRWRIGWRWFLVTLLGLPLLTLAIALLLGDTLEPVHIIPFAITQVLGLLVNLVLINIWEETAWAGFIQTRLEQRHSLMTAALITAIPFALVHMPLHFIGDFTISSLTAALVTLLIVSALVRVLLGVVLRGAANSILAVALVHTLFNRSNNDEGVVAGLVQGEARSLAGLLAVLVLATLLAIGLRGRLDRATRLSLDSAEATAVKDISTAEERAR